MRAKDTRVKILGLLRCKMSAYGPESTDALMAPDELALSVGISRHAMHEFLCRLLREGEVVRICHGWYRIASAAPIVRAEVTTAPKRSDAS